MLHGMDNRGTGGQGDGLREPWDMGQENRPLVTPFRGILTIKNVSITWDILAAELYGGK